MGEVEVPADALWGAQTQRAVDNFPVSGERIGRDLIGALGCIKGAAARVNGELGVIDAEMADAIHAAATAVARELAGFVWAIACKVKPADKPAAPEIIRTCRGKVYQLDANKKFQKTK